MNYPDEKFSVNDGRTVTLAVTVDDDYMHAVLDFLRTVKGENNALYKAAYDHAVKLDY